MHKTDGANHVANLFDAGDPGVPRNPTTVDPAIMNAIMMELVNAVEAAGIVLVKGTWTQLKAAMGMGATPAATARNFSATHTVDVATGNAVVGTTGSATAGHAGVTGNSELATGVEGNTTDGVAGSFNATGTGKAIEANGPVDINGAVTADSAGDAVTGTSTGGYGLVAAGDPTTPYRASFRIVPQDTAPSGPQQGDLYVNSGSGKLVIYDGATWVVVGTQA